MKFLSMLHKIIDTILRATIVALLFVNFITMKVLIKQQQSEINQLLYFGQIVYNYQKTTNKNIEDIRNKIREPNFDLIRKATVQIYNDNRGIKGSGVCIDYKDKKYILSAFHLNSSNEMYVLDGEKRIKITAILTDEYNDLVLFKPLEDLNTVEYIVFVNSQATIGEKIWACGNCLGILDNITHGIIIKEDYSERSYLIDAPIFYGNSGGGVFNKNTELIGIISQFISGFNIETLEGVSYGGIINIDTIEEFLGQLN